MDGDEDREWLQGMQQSLRVASVESWAVHCLSASIPGYVLSTAGEPFAVQVSTEPSWGILSSLSESARTSVAFTTFISVQLSTARKLPPIGSILIRFSRDTAWEDAFRVPIFARIKAEQIVFGQWTGVASLGAREMEIGLKNSQTQLVYSVRSMKIA